ncbi:hypothetical protein C8Q75DRAFT_482022 [Abortiporus biennis]|nr:hypothetical protein C8Q75DRAFT_482022 [Abortiporus biennis]
MSSDSSVALPPKHAQILVIGGGPGGSYAATALAREGYDVVLLEMAKLPRYHIGESLIPSVRHFLRFIDAEEKVANHGFARKPGSAIKFNQFMVEGYTDFVALGAHNSAWNVVRSEFDYLLYKHAAENGVQTFDEIKVNTIQFSMDPLSPHDTGLCEGDEDLGGVPVSASYVTAQGVKGDISFDYLVDASGRAGIMSTKYLKNRRFNESLKNVAVWGYWKNVGMYGKGTSRENAPWFEALSDESGWAWFIPLHDGLTSIGVVMDQKSLGVRSRACSSASGSPFPFSTSTPSSPIASHFPSSPIEEPSARRTQALAERYLTFLHLAPGVLNLMGDKGELVSIETKSEDGSSTDGDHGKPPMARSASDFSYSANRYSGRNWRIVGDAGAFIDPFFSSGIHLAMTSALAAATSIAASIKSDCSEVEAAEWYSRRFAISYTRFLVVVLSAYKQIRAQSTNILADIEHENFDKAFEFLRPMIQGGAEMGAKLSEDEVQRALDFCVNLFNPTTPDQHESVRQKLEHVRINECEYFTSKKQEPLEEEREDDNDTSLPPTRDGESLLDVHAPLIDPTTLAKVLRSRFRLRIKTPSFSSFSSAGSTMGGSLPSPSTSIFSVPPSPTFNSETCSSTSSCGEDVGAVEGDEEDDNEMKLVLEKVNGRRVIHADYGEGNSLEQENVNGFIVRLERGRLGLDTV